MANQKHPKLPYTRHRIEEDDIEAVTAALRSGWLTSGPAVERFESALADKVGTRAAVSCASGTAALHLAMLALDLKPGDRVVVPAMTFLATASAVRLAGAELIFADVDANTGLMTAETLETALADRDDVRAVIPVHLNGQCADMSAIGKVAARHDLAVVEDAAHAIGSRYSVAGDDVAVGACRHSLMVAFSFHPAKLVTMGEGGAVTVSDPALAERLRELREHGRIKDPDGFEGSEAFDEEGRAHPWYYEVQRIAPNYRANDMQCALGASQLTKLERFVALRRERVALYDLLLRDSPHVQPLVRLSGQQPAWHLYPVLIDFDVCGVSRDEVMGRLAAQGIGTQVHYVPLHRQPYFARRYGRQTLPGAERYYRRVLSLPLFPDLTEDDVNRVVTELMAALRIKQCGTSIAQQLPF